MNREIKFRIWDNHTKHFATCVYETNKDCYLFIGRSGYVTAFNCYGEEIDFQDGRFTIQQYTGLKDSKGVEIYEGDIVDCKYDDEKVIAEIKYSEEYAAFLCGENALWQGWLGKAEIIGNIMETPELIKNNDNNNQ
jgi:uncharacterized phage protein (TIGR01671 family)